MYNVKRLNYASGHQLRLYLKPIEEGKKGAKKDINEVDENQNDEIMEKEVKTDEEKKAHSEIVSQNRTIQSVYAIARANEWDLFVTFTFSPQKIDRSDYNAVKKAACVWLNHQKSRCCPDLKYLIVPELHKDGINWHLHGLLANIDGLELVDSGIVQNGHKIFNLPKFRFGWTTASYVESQAQVSRYITKYITKEVCGQIKGKQRYCASRNCLRLKDVTENINLAPEQVEQLLKEGGAGCAYLKEQVVPVAGQRITYLEYED